MNIPILTFRDRCLLVASGIVTYPPKVSREKMDYLWRKKFADKRTEKRRELRKQRNPQPTKTP